MPRMKIILDSTGDIPREWIDKLDVTIAPLHIVWPDGNQEDDTRDLDQIRDFYSRISNASILPKTSQPSVGEFVNLFKEIQNAGYEEVLTICISRNLSGTYDSAITASQQVDIPVKVLDTKLASGAMPFVALRARELERAGMNIEEIYKNLESEISQGRYRAIFYVSNFDFLIKGGRVSKFQGFIGSLLKIHVGLWIDPEGKLIPFEKARGLKRAQEMLIRKTEQLVPPGSKIRLIMVDADAREHAKALLEILKKRYQVESFVFSEMGKVITTHVGPGTAGYGLEVLT